MAPSMLAAMLILLAACWIYRLPWSWFECAAIIPNGRAKRRGWRKAATG